MTEPLVILAKLVATVAGLGLLLGIFGDRIKRSVDAFLDKPAAPNGSARTASR
jgi:hypothetical protein